MIDQGVPLWCPPPAPGLIYRPFSSSSPDTTRPPDTTRRPDTTRPPDATRPPDTSHVPFFGPQTLGPLDDEHYDSYGATYELYGTSRMLLAALERHQLEQVCCGWNCDMWEVLAPVRAARPVNGGPAFDPDLTLDLRTLNLMFE